MGCGELREHREGTTAPAGEGFIPATGAQTEFRERLMECNGRHGARLGRGRQRSPLAFPHRGGGTRGAPRLRQPAWRAGFPSGLCQSSCAGRLRHIGMRRQGDGMGEEDERGAPEPWNGMRAENRDFSRVQIISTPLFTAGHNPMDCHRPPSVASVSPQVHPRSDTQQFPPTNSLSETQIHVRPPNH